MIYTLERTEAPTSEPISTAEMKRHLNLYEEITDRDVDVDQLITAAREWVEDLTGRALFAQTWTLSFDASTPATNPMMTPNTVSGEGIVRRGFYTGIAGFQAQAGLLLRRAPVLDVVSVESIDSLGVATTISTDQYRIADQRSRYPRILPLSGTWQTGGLKITYRAGYADTEGSPAQGTELVPARILTAMKLWATAMWDADKDTMEKHLEIAAKTAMPERIELGLA